MTDFKPKNTGNSAIVCPNHGEPLEGIGFPIPSKGTGICPVSKCPFDFEVEVDQEEVTIDKFGNSAKGRKWNVTGDEVIKI